MTKLFIALFAVLLAVSVVTPVYAGSRAFLPEHGDGWLNVVPGDVLENQTSHTWMNCFLGVIGNGSVVIDGVAREVHARVSNETIAISFPVRPGSVIAFGGVSGLCQVSDVVVWNAGTHVYSVYNPMISR